MHKVRWGRVGAMWSRLKGKLSWLKGLVVKLNGNELKLWKNELKKLKRGGREVDLETNEQAWMGIGQMGIGHACSEWGTRLMGNAHWTMGKNHHHKNIISATTQLDHHHHHHHIIIRKISPLSPPQLGHPFPLPSHTGPLCYIWQLKWGIVDNGLCQLPAALHIKIPKFCVWNNWIPRKWERMCSLLWDHFDWWLLLLESADVSTRQKQIGSLIDIFTRRGKSKSLIGRRCVQIYFASGQRLYWKPCQNMSHVWHIKKIEASYTVFSQLTSWPTVRGMSPSTKLSVSNEIFYKTF